MTEKRMRGMDVELSDSRLVEGSVVLAHNVGGKLMSVGVLTRAELQEFVQQAHDRYGVTADPFATPGSGDVDPEGDPWPERVGHGAGLPDSYFAALERQPRSFA